MDSLLRIKLKNKYNLYHRQKISFNELKDMSVNEGIELEDLYKIFDISLGSKTKFRQAINSSCFITIYSQEEIYNIKQELGQTNKFFIDMAKEKHKLTNKALNEIKKGYISKSTLKFDLDIKYIYGEIFINRRNIENFEEIYNSNEDELIGNIAKNKNICSAYRYAMKNNKRGIHILNDTRISNKFIEENYKELDEYLEMRATIKCIAYRCFSMKDDLKSEAYEQIIRIGGIYEKNIKNKVKVIQYLINIADSKMNAYISKTPRFASLMYKIDGIEKEFEIPDNTYNPENYI